LYPLPFCNLEVAPLQRVWRALTDSGEFGYCFGMKFSRPFKPGGMNSLFRCYSRLCAKAFGANSPGWAMVLTMIEDYLEQHP
jgi:hypothetical protein